MIGRRLLITVFVMIALLGAGGLVAAARSRQADCAYVPLLGEELLPNAALAPGENARMPQGWSARAAGVELQSFAYDGDGRALQLIGIGNYAQTPPVDVRPGASYCFTGRALTDSDKRSATRLRAVFDWRDAHGASIQQDATDWQMVVLWQENDRPDDWSKIEAAFAAPPGAASLVIRLQPASDDRVYLDAMHVRQGGSGIGGQGSANQLLTPEPRPLTPTVKPWPNGYAAAISFSFDWETAMGGLIHSRSVDDPNAGEDYLLRAMRMRAGVTTTLDLFRPYGIRATYYANGYNFLLGNTERRQFMGDPTFEWADSTTSKKWPNDAWTTTPWFSHDPYGTVQSEPAWYFGDLIAPLQNERQDIQSHTFSHFDGGLARPQEWQADLEAWIAVAGERGVTPARSLAFPWSSSAGMSYASWGALEAAGITSVTRTKPNQLQYELASSDDPHCKPVPGHERILACPDFYLHSQATADEAIELIDRIIAENGVIDLWAHTEEVVSPEQIAAWGQVVRYAARSRDAGKLWIAPLAEIADWQHAIANITISSNDRSGGKGVQLNALTNTPTTTNDPQHATGDAALSFSVTNSGQRELDGLTLVLPFAPDKVMINNERIVPETDGNMLVLNMQAGQTMEVSAWPA